MSRTDQEWLGSIADSVQYIAASTAGLSFAEYAQDETTISAVERHFIIIGESVAQLEQQSPETAAGISHKREIIGMRNVLAHRFYEVNDRIVWNTITNDLPLLRAEVRQLLSGGATEP